MISVLTVNYRSAADVAALADSIVAHRGGEDVELVIINHSPAERVELPADAAEFARVLARPNAGFAAGVNAALGASRGELLFIANPDLRIGPATLASAARVMREQPDVGVLLPLLRHPDGRVQDSVRRFYTWPVALFARSPLRALGWRPAIYRRYLYDDLDRSRPRDVDWGLGGAMFIRRSDCEGGRVFDPRFFLYFEDVDLCWRMWRRGRRVVYCPHVECVHAHRRASAVPFGRHGWHHFVSFLRFVAKYGGLPRRPPAGG